MRPADAGADHDRGLGLYAPWSRRVTATVIDAIPLTPLYVFDQSTDFANAGGALQIIYWVVATLSAVYLVANIVVIQGRRGASFGKKAMNIAVVSATTQLPLGIVRTVVRALAHVLDLIPCGVGFLWPIWDPNRQTFADKFAASAVINRSAVARSR